MALERKDIRAKLDAEVHEALRAICDIDGVDMGEFIESLIVPVVKKRVHDAMLLSRRLQRSGISGIVREKRGVSGNRGAEPGESGNSQD